MIKYDYEITVNGNQAKLNKDIYLFRGNKNVHYYFAVKNASFNFKGSTDLIEKTNAINAAVTVIKPNNVEVASAIAKVENGKIHLKVTEDLIDEEVEVGDFDLVFDLFDDTDGAVTIPKVIGQFHVLERPCTTPISELVATNTTNEVDQALTDYAIVTYAEPVASTNADGTFAKKTWVAKEKITTAELNRMEKGISDVSSQFKDIANLSLTKHTDGKIYIKKQDGTLIGTGVKVSSDADLSKVTMSVNGNTLKLLNDGTQIATVDLPEGSGEVPDNTVMYEEDDESIDNAINAENIVIKDTDNNFTATHVEGALKELFQSASNGKQLIANAITGKGVVTNVSDSFQTMATNIKNISSGSAGGGGITPTGTKEITQNGTYDVTNFASVLVNVASSGGSTGVGGNIESGTITPTKQSTTLDIPTTKKCSNLVFFQHEMIPGVGYRMLTGLIRCGGVGINLASNSNGSTLNVIGTSGNTLACVVVTFNDNSIHISSDKGINGGGYFVDKQYDWYAW